MPTLPTGPTGPTMPEPSYPYPHPHPNTSASLVDVFGELHPLDLPPDIVHTLALGGQGGCCPCTGRPCVLDPVSGGTTTQLVVRSSLPPAAAPARRTRRSQGRLSRRQLRQGRQLRHSQGESSPTPRTEHVEHVEHADGTGRTGHLVITVFGFPTSRCRACGTESQDQAIRVAAAVVVESRLSRGEVLAAGVAFSDLELPPLTKAGIAPARW